MCRKSLKTQPPFFFLFLLSLLPVFPHAENISASKSELENLHLKEMLAFLPSSS